MATDPLTYNYVGVPPAEMLSRRFQMNLGKLIDNTDALIANIDNTVTPIVLSTVAPVAESLVAVTGLGAMAARDDYSHPRLSSASRVTLGADGTATITYSRSFNVKPSISLIAINPAGQPIALEVVNDIQTGALYTGCKIKGRRAQTLPAVLTLLTNLINFDIFGGTIPAGLEVSVIALMPSA